MANLGKTITAVALALSLWLSRQPFLRGTGFGALAVVSAVAWVAYVLTRGLRLLWLSAFELRELPVRRDARWLAVANGLVALGLLVESQRLADPFWWQCALAPAALAACLALRLTFTRALHRSPWAGRAGDLAKPASSWPYVRVTATATHAPGASGAASVSIRF